LTVTSLLPGIPPRLRNTISASGADINGMGLEGAGASGGAISLRPPGISGFLGRHPVILLLILTPGIPEYLSGSSQVALLVQNPLAFAIFLVLNISLYGPGVLLVREAVVKWQKGWASVLLLGGAYGILEEGVALSTLFYSKASPVGELGYYGHWLGVSWLWSEGVILVHVIFSISIPIMLLGIAIPSTRGRGLLSNRKAAALFGILGADVLALSVITSSLYHFWMGLPLLVSSLATIGVLILAARRVGASRLIPREGPGSPPWKVFAAGASCYLAVLLIESVGKALGLIAAEVIAIVAVYEGGLLLYILRSVGTGRNTRNRVALAAGLILPVAFIGLVSQLSAPVVIVADIAMILFLRRLYGLQPVTGSPDFAQSPTASG
jgi:hypothetical protein